MFFGKFANYLAGAILRAGECENKIIFFAFLSRWDSNANNYVHSNI